MEKLDRDEEAANLMFQTIVQQAGVDFEARPMLVISSCNFPNPKTYDYDDILERIMKKLETFVENDYIIVLFTAGGDHKPGWRWMYKAYKALNRNYKKNLKQLYVVHPNLWIKLVMDAMKAVISPKFSEKLVHVATLSQLASLVPYRQIRVPDQVVVHNMKFESYISVPDRKSAVANAGKVFGAPLETLMGLSGENGVPIPILHCVDFLRREGMEVEGIFRRSPSSSQLKGVKETFDSGKLPDFSQFDSGVHLAAVTIKLYLRDLPAPLIPISLYDQMTGIFGVPKANPPAEIILQFMSQMPKASFLLLVYLLRFFHLLAGDETQVDKHKMNASNLGIVIAPNLVKWTDPVGEMNMARCAAVFIKCSLERYDELHRDGMQSPEGFNLKQSHSWTDKYFKI